MSKCKIPKKHRPRAQSTASCVIRIGAEQYQTILDICEDTGRSMTDVTNRLLGYALDAVEIVDAEIA